MRVFVKQGDVHIRTYWIKREKSSVLGWFGGSMIANVLNLPTKDVDVHFTYPSDGNLHFSLKYMDHAIGKETYVTVYCDKVKRKLVAAAGRAKDVWEEPRPAGYDVFSWLMPRFRPPPLAEYAAKPLFFQFPVVAIPISRGVVVFGPKELAAAEAERPRAGDLIVDAGSVSTGGVNVAGFLCGAGQVAPWTGSDVCSATDSSEVPMIVASAKFFENPD